MVKELPDMGLVGVIAGVPSPQSTQEGEETENDIVKSSVLTFPAESWHFT
jgi:hypothetical protein